MDAATRREARKRWTTNVFRSFDEADEYDLAFWLTIPIGERAEATWKASQEAFRLAFPDRPNEPRLSRSTAVVTRR